MSTKINIAGRLSSDRSDWLRSVLSSADIEIKVDGTEVKSVGALCAEELYKARATRMDAGGTWCLSASTEMCSDLELLGLSTILENFGDEQ